MRKNIPVTILILLLSFLSIANGTTKEEKTQGIPSPEEISSLLQEVQKEAEQGDPNSCCIMGAFHMNRAGTVKGKECDEDREKAIDYYTIAAEEGILDAQIALGFLYLVKEEQAEQAVKWFQKAAEQGSAKGQYQLGQLYLKGKGITQDKKKGLIYLIQAGKQGHSQALYDLGQMYQKGHGLPQNQFEAMECYKKAAKKGHKEAPYSIGVIFAKGEITGEPNYFKAYAWTYVSYLKHYKNASALLRQLKPHLTQDQIERAIANAREVLQKIEEHQKNLV